MSVSDTTISWCSVPSSRATIRWYLVSSYSGTSKRSENVEKRALVARRASAAMRELSSPPDT
jgi:hypothetical protein